MAVIIGAVLLLVSVAGTVRYLLYGSFALNPLHHGFEGETARYALLIMAGGGILLWIYSSVLVVRARWIERRSDLR